MCLLLLLFQSISLSLSCSLSKLCIIFLFLAKIFKDSLDSIKKSINTLNQDFNQCIHLYNQRETVGSYFVEFFF